MLKLIEGIHKFRQEELGRYQALFHRLSLEGQKPHTLFITCSDSRVLAELITQSQPGDLFVVKNAGNLVPPSHLMGNTNATAAAIEFAVQILEVSDIVVCGHSQCGAIAALLHGLPAAEEMPHLKTWLDVASPVRQIIERNYQHLQNDEERLTAASEENVLYALENLHTYPEVAKRLESGTLRLHGWFFKIGTAELFAYDMATQQFQLISPPTI
ncbi:MAG: carbonic anhydrase [Parachlamydia sp.]|nr:carbonic anhydrase [Parachlamydia sp.]